MEHDCEGSIMTWIASETQSVDIASYDNSNREFDGVYTYRAIAGCGLPPRTCFDAPEIKAGFAPVRSADDTQWEYIEDHRGEKVYSTETGAEIEITELGSHPAKTTPLKPATPHDFWDGKNWVTDTAKQKAELVAQADAKKQSLISEATREINILADAVEFGMATPEEEARYTALRKYRVELNRVDTSSAPDITWPQKP